MLQQIEATRSAGVKLGLAGYLRLAHAEAGHAPLDARQSREAARLLDNERSAARALGVPRLSTVQRALVSGLRDGLARRGRGEGTSWL